MRPAPLVGMGFGLAMLILSMQVHPAIRLVYNPTASAPQGWYRVEPGGDLHVGDYVIARLPHAMARFAAARGYLPFGVPVLKQIVATAGHNVCETEGDVTVDRILRATTLPVDVRGRRMPQWDQCRILLPNELFLLNEAHPASFDSRYFGPLDASFVIGRAVAVWTWR
jgi:conjugative transfer signal peptidase TraF